MRVHRQGASSRYRFPHQAGTHAMIRKQLLSLGCPLWANNPAPQILPERVDLADKCIRLYMYTSDGGADQRKLEAQLFMHR